MGRLRKGVVDHVLLDDGLRLQGVQPPIGEDLLLDAGCHDLADEERVVAADVLVDDPTL